MVQAGFGYGGVELLRQLGKGELRGLQAEACGLLELVRKLLEHPRGLELSDGVQLDLGGFHGFVQVGAVAVEAAVDAVAEVLFQLGGHDGDGGGGGPDEGEEVGDLVALLEVGDAASVAGDVFGGEAALAEKGFQFAAGLEVGAGEFQVVALGGLGHAASGEEAAAEEGGAAAGFLHHGEVDVEGQVLAGVVAQEVDDMVQLFALGDLEGELPDGGSPLSGGIIQEHGVGLAVEAEGESPLKEPGKPRREVQVFGDNPYLRRTECMAVKQNTVSLRPRAA